MARINDLDNLSKLLGVLPSIEDGFVPYGQLADKMGCSEADARRTVEHVCETEMSSAELGICAINTPDDLAEWIGGDDLAAFDDGDGASLDAGNKDTGSSHSDVLPAAAKAFDKLGGPGVLFNISSKLLGARPRLSFDESWALLIALAFAGVDDDAPLAKSLAKAACPGDFDTQSQALAIMGSMEDYSILRELALLCAQRRLARIRYESASSDNSANSALKMGFSKEAEAARVFNPDVEPESCTGPTTNAGAQASDASIPAVGGETDSAAVTAKVAPLSKRKILPIELYVGDNGETYLFAYQYPGDADDSTSGNPGGSSIDDAPNGSPNSGGRANECNEGGSRSDQCRVFKISRVLDVEPLPQHARDPRILALERSKEDVFLKNPANTARLQLESGCPFDKRVWLHAEVVDVVAGKSVIAMPLQDDTSWIARSIASKLGEAKVREPESLANDVRAAAAKALEEMDGLQAEFERRDSR